MPDEPQLLILTAGDVPIGVFDSREKAVEAWRRLSIDMSRYLRWYLHPCHLNKPVDFNQPVEPFAWGDTLVTDENRSYILEK